MSSDSLHKHPLLISIGLALIGLCVVGQIYLPIPILAEINHQFGNSRNLAGWVSSTFSIGYATGFLFSGPLSDKFGRRRVMLTGFVALVIFTALVSQSKNFGQLLLYRVLQGASASAYPPIILAYLGEKLPISLKRQAISLMSLGFLTSGIISQLYAIKLKNYGFGIIEISFVLIYFVSFLFVYFIVNDDGLKNVLKPKLINIYKKIPFILLDKNLKLLYASTLCTLSVLVAFYILMDLNYATNFESKNIHQLTTRVIALPAMLGSLFAPMLISKKGSIFLMRWSFFVASVGLTLAAVAIFCGSVFGLLYSSIIFIAGRALSVPSLVNAIGDFAEQESKGTAIALYTFTLFIGASFGPVIAHMLSIFSYFIASLILAMISGIPFILTLWITNNATDN